MKKMKKYVQVGCGSRGIHAFAVPLVKEYGDCAELCGVYDINSKRAALVSEYAGKAVPVYEDFDQMLAEVQPDTVIVTTKDSVHDKYIIRALQAGCDVISEKPLTTTFEKAQTIKCMQEETGRDVIVTFNLRFQPFFKRIKEMLCDGVIGDILSVHFEWLLNTKHGADYFRRWHRQKENSGSLLVHKSTHHFDLINWFLEDEPISVNAFGTRRFYGPTREKRSERCLSCPHKKTCEFYMDIRENGYDRLYMECEDVDGYYRDRCVFSEEIDIEDNICVNVNYKKGTVMSYTLTAHSPYEGMRMILNGTAGRMEINRFTSSAANYQEEAKDTLQIFSHQGDVIQMQVPKGKTEGHGGADEKLRDCLFRERGEDPLGQMADLHAGLMSIGIGMAANVSMAEKRQVALNEFYGVESTQ